MMIFCKSDPKSCKELISILQKYESAFGQKINRQKSAITFSAKTISSVKQQVKNALGIQQEEGTGEYLGLPEHFGSTKKKPVQSNSRQSKAESTKLVHKTFVACGKDDHAQVSLGSYANVYHDVLQTTGLTHKENSICFNKILVGQE
ncbi:unnamed protein product [Microthlaspi erraticum]|uniref:Reverse transcriptase domain-containing protein n=1 Tax=Microthlaspi erraticum TaxID=1685480 RepID=A0A6D2HK98_9BRAS|nr:unnamed protein product [Microthlaspi erraticum]